VPIRGRGLNRREVCRTVDPLMVGHTRRSFMLRTAGSALLGLLCRTPAARSVDGSRFPRTAKPLPLSAIRLLPSDYATAVEVNRGYLLALSPDRLLHNFRKYAGLEPKAAVYGGWESDTLAGHTLGHYLSALVLMHAQTGDLECRQRADYIVSELAIIQDRRGTGYVGALGRRRKDGTIVDGEEIFPEVMRGEIHASAFDLNGSWSPLYTVHKVLAGLLDVHAGWHNAQALVVATRFASYFERTFAPLDDVQMQNLLSCEYGGLNESYAELYERTGELRWLKVAERLYDRKVLDPLTRQEDRLANLHANTQVPKLIGLARLHELSGKPEHAAAARFFWEAVTGHHSYVIGGNADREYFSAPDTIGAHITEQTCEHCNSYNMLKLTEHLFAWSPQGDWFDFYERAHLNHVMAAHKPATGGFTYMTPLMSGAAREYSNPAEDPFWCCVGTGMESHAKHGGAIFWEGEGALLVNLYIPAQAHWQTRAADLRLETRYPFEGSARLSLSKLARPAQFPIALRIPAWARPEAVGVSVNDEPINIEKRNGYAVVARRWKAGDAVKIELPLELRIESAAGDPSTVVILRGPMVLAGDLGPDTAKWSGADPALVGDESLLKKFATSDESAAIYETRGIARPSDLTFVPFYKQFDRLSAVYFKRFSEPEWHAEQVAFVKAQERMRDIDARSVDTVHLGEMEAERDHRLVSERSYPVAYRGRHGRDARSGGFFEFDMSVGSGPLLLHATYWGEERPRDFDILVDDALLATQHLDAEHPGEFFDVEYVLSQELTHGKQRLRVRFLPQEGSTAGPVFGVRLLSDPGKKS
jgi:uncharacterized protein